MQEFTYKGRKVEIREKHFSTREAEYRVYSDGSFLWKGQKGTKVLSEWAKRLIDAEVREAARQRGRDEAIRQSRVWIDAQEAK